MAAGLGVAAGLLGTAAPASGGPLGEPVTVIAAAPAEVVAGKPFRLAVEVSADPGALLVAAQPLRLRVRFAPECGGSFAGTEGPTALERTLPAPAARAPYTANVTSEETLGATGPETICAFLEDAQERQFATDTEATLTVVSSGGAASCPVATKQLRQLQRRGRKLDRRIHKLRRRVRHADSRKVHRHLARKLRKLRHKRHRVGKQTRETTRDVSVACGQGSGS